MPAEHTDNTFQAAEDISRRLIESLKDGGLRVTIDAIDQPAYMVNYNLEITWFNDAARPWLGETERFPEDTRARHVLRHLAKGIYGGNADNQTVFNKLHWEAGHSRLAGSIRADQTAAGIGVKKAPIAQFTIRLWRNGELEEFLVYVSYFREGMLFVFTHDIAVQGDLLGLLAQRDVVIRDLLKKQLPVLTDLAVLVADLQSSTLICLQLPPEEYFTLINQMWADMVPVFRRYYGTYGKHVGDGMVYYFLPQPDCNYLVNAVKCAMDLRAEMRRLNQEWQLRKNWDIELKLKIGLHAGSEWLGTFHIDSKVEFAVLGDTINQAARLSEFARGGTVWASKALITQIAQEERRKIRYGIRRKDREGVESIVESTFSPVGALTDFVKPHEKLQDIAAMPVTEIFEIQQD
ncbi:MAG: adenylate/guanylate cyclase domain-containing protein [Methylophilaceae bacterium]|nr:adenylate/guanylate cyclase domain-containing protein [Methylophilaceae bacterium]